MKNPEQSGFFAFITFVKNDKKLFLPYVTSFLVSNSFSRCWQELPLVALPPPEKSSFQPAKAFHCCQGYDIVLKTINL